MPSSSAAAPRAEFARESTRNTTTASYDRVVKRPASSDAKLAEFAALRAEIAQRSSTQQALIALNLTAVATVLGFALTKQSSRGLLLLVPVISPSLGLLWLDHHRNIRLIAEYIRDELWKDSDPSWETWRGARGSSGAVIAFFLSVALIFGATAAGSWAAGWPGWTATSGVLLLSGCGALLTLVFVAAYVAVMVVEFSHAPSL